MREHAVHDVAAPPKLYVSAGHVEQAPALRKLPGAQVVIAGAAQAALEVEPVAPEVV